MSTAAVMADLLGNNGHKWTARDGRGLEDLVREHGGRAEYALCWISLGVFDYQTVSAENHYNTMRYVFPDGSAIVVDGNWWGIEDPDKPFRTVDPPPDY